MRKGIPSDSPAVVQWSEWVGSRPKNINIERRPPVYREGGWGFDRLRSRHYLDEVN